MPANRIGALRNASSFLKQLIPVDRRHTANKDILVVAAIQKKYLSTYSHPHREDLLPPSILYESNHLLVVNKPVGWQSVPNKEGNNNIISNKCLLQYLIQHKLGGGSQRTFLKPLHRIDQPCSGVLVLGKTSRVASRIQSAWNDVKKTYLVVARPPPPLAQPLGAHPDAQPTNTTNIHEWQTAAGYMLRHQSPHNNAVGRKAASEERRQSAQTNRGWSVTMIPADPNHKRHPRNLPEDQYRYCTLNWRCLTDRLSPPPTRPSQQRAEEEQQHDYYDYYSLLQIQTSQGARHMVRALLACHGWAVAGDCRYGPHPRVPLPDQSVALHAATLELPAQLPLGSSRDAAASTVDRQRCFVAPIPERWSQYFGITQSDVEKLLE